MNPNNSDTAEMLKKLLVACLAGLEAGYVRSAPIDAEYAVAGAKITKGSTTRAHEKFTEDLHCPQHGAGNRSVCPRSPALTA